MKRPLFLVLAGLVLGEVLAAVWNWKGFLIVGFLLLGTGFFFVFLCFFSHVLHGKRGKRNRQDRLVGRRVWIGIFLAAFLIGGVRFSGEMRMDELEEERTEDSLEGTLTGEIVTVKVSGEGNYSLTLQNVFFFSKKKENGKKDRNRTKKTKIEKQECLLERRCQVFGIPLLAGKLFPGDRISVSGTLYPMNKPVNPGEFDSRTYYYSRGIRYRFYGEHLKKISEKPFGIRRAAYRFAKWLDGVYGRIFGDREHALLKAMVLGDKTELTREETLLYEENGVAHLLAVSGLHVSVVGGQVFFFLRKRGRSYAFSCLSGSILLIFYGMVTGFGNSVFRAVVMFLLFLFSQYFGAEYDMTSSMSLAGILMLWDSPWRLWESGCIISFVCVFAIGFLLPAVRRMQKNRRRKNQAEGEISDRKPWQKRLGDALTASIVISMASGPLILRFYYQWSPYSILLNLVVIPAMNPLMVSALFGGLAGIMGDFVAFCGCIPAYGILRLFHLLFSLTKKIPGALIVTGCPSWPVVIGLYLMEVLVFFLWYHRAWKAAAVIFFLIAGGILFKPSLEMKVAMLDVGQGECIFLRFPNGKSAIIDGGSTSKQKIAEYIMIPAFKYYGEDHLDYVFLTHTDEDHLSGICELMEEGYPIRNLFLPERLKKNRNNQGFLKIKKLAAENKVHLSYLSKGDILSIGKVRLTCLHPPSTWKEEEENAGSLTMYLQYKKFHALFTGDLNQEQEALVLEVFKKRNAKTPERLCLLKVAHHGSKYSTTGEFLQKWKPETAIISAGKKNWYGHPHKETLSRIKKAGSAIYTTSWGGAVIASSDGRNFQIRYFSQKNSRKVFYQNKKR